jgi:protease I
MMTARNQLAGQRFAVLAADGFENAELKTPVEALKAAGAEVDIVSLRRGRIRGMNQLQPADLVRVDKSVDEVRARDYAGILIPGGYNSPDQLRQSAGARDFVREFDAQGKPIASLCHGACVLASAGLAQNRTLTSWPGIRDDMVNAGATWLDEEVVRDGNLLSCRSPQDMVSFVRDMVQLFSGGAGSNDALRRRLSDPQRAQPSTTPGAAMRWLGTPSMGTLVGLALIGAGVMAATRDKTSADKVEAPTR